jgi:hypothetical protein
MNVTRRTVLRLLSAAPLAATSACGARISPPAAGTPAAGPAALEGTLAPAAAARLTASPIVDVHAHFFNASDVPVRGFLAECVAHSQPEPLRTLIRAAARLADGLAAAAPTAAAELTDLERLGAPGAAISQDGIDKARDDANEEAARGLAETLRGSEFERLYRQMQEQSAQPAAPGRSRSGPITVDDIRQVVQDAEQPGVTGLPAAPVLRGNADYADGALGFLKYMVSPRWVNLRSYMTTYTTGPGAFGIDHVLGALVDFDHWLQRPPRSKHDDQVRLHQRLFEMHRRSPANGGPYFYPIVAYNPWSDIRNGGASLKRVVDACTTGDFVAVKIYPPTGFMPAGNAWIPESQLTKPHPNTRKLDETLEAFFAKCAELKIPVLAHAAPSNGRDNLHDGFGGPDGWNMLLSRHAAMARVQTVDFGHFGGARRNWTREFAGLMVRHSRMPLFGDLGYWEELMCGHSKPQDCTAARQQLGDAMRTSIPGTGETVVDRVMFATDWLMLSQVKRWAEYPQQLHDSLRQILMDDAAVAKVFGGNALKCFSLRRPPAASEGNDG